MAQTAPARLGLEVVPKDRGVVKGWQTGVERLSGRVRTDSDSCELTQTLRQKRAVRGRPRPPTARVLPKGGGQNRKGLPQS